jgi:hypothetical protein
MDCESDNPLRISKARNGKCGKIENSKGERTKY